MGCLVLQPALALRTTSTSSVGISFLKSHNFLGRINEHLALGAHYQEVNDGYFKAPVFEAEVKQLGRLAQPYINAIDAYRLNAVPQARLPFNIIWE